MMVEVVCMGLGGKGNKKSVFFFLWMIFLILPMQYPNYS